MKERCTVLLRVIALFCIVAPALAQEEKGNPTDNVEMRGPRGVFSATSGEACVLYADSMPGEEWGEKINRAIAKLRDGADGGTVLLPAGHLKISTTIDFTANRRAAPTGIVLQGAGGASATRLIWEGKPNSAMIFIPSPWHCQVRGVYLDADKAEGITGIHFPAGWSRGWNVSRHLMLDDVVFRHCKIGLDIGDIYSPDLSQHLFQGLWFWQCETGVRVTGANVANLWFYGISMDGGVKTCFDLIGHSARKIRKSADEPMPTDGSDVLRDQDGREVFWDSVPELPKKQGQVDQFFGKDKGYYAGGGYPELVVYGLEVHTSTPDAWVIRTNFAPIRIYSARCEGPGGLLRHTSPLGDFRNNVVLVDVSAVCKGEGSNGNVIEHHGKGPLYLIGCNFNGNVALADTRVFANGVHFMKEGLGFTQLPDRTGAVIHQTHFIHQQTVAVPEGAKAVRVPLTGVNRQRNADYQVLVTPRFRCGGFWVSNQDRDGFAVNFELPAPAGALVGTLVTHEPMLNSKQNY